VPELPEVETVRRGLAELIMGRRVEQAWCGRSDLRYPFPAGFVSALEGSVISRIDRRGKYLLFALGDGRLLAWHLGMTGQFHVLPAQSPAAKHEHVRLLLDDGGSLRYRDARRFGYAGLMDEDHWQSHPWFAHMGPEPLSEDFNAAVLAGLCRGRKSPIKGVIMDAHVVAGIGNIYACEALYGAGIHPGRAAGRISLLRLQGLIDSIRTVLLAAIEAGGSSISDFVRADGRPGMFAHQFSVYGRAGKPCPACGGEIRRIVQAGRSSFFCPGCQH